MPLISTIICTSSKPRIEFTRMSRWVAATIHLSISALIALLVFSLLFFVWFPPPYFQAAGADELAILVIGVDISVGPLLTLVVFRHGKPGLRFDLAIIGVLQVAALTYGMSVVLRTRPVFLVGAVDRFNLVLANDIEPADLAAAKQPLFRHLSWSGPKLVAVKLPSDPTDALALTISGLAGKDAQDLPKYYVPYSSQAKALWDRAKAVSEIPIHSPHDRVIVNAWLEKHGLHESEVRWLPVVARNRSVTMFLRKGSMQPVGAVDVSPW